MVLIGILKAGFPLARFAWEIRRFTTYEKNIGPFCGNSMEEGKK
jgi:hypothetical protein